MKKTYKVTITLSYEGVLNSKALKKAVFNEASSWVNSGSFGDDLYISPGNGELMNSKVSIVTLKPKESKDA